MKSFLIVCALFVSTLVLSSPAQAADADRMTAFLTQLGVSTQQMSDIQAVHAQAKPQLEAAKQTLHTDRQNLRKQVASADATDDQLQALYSTVSTDAQALHKLRFAALLKVRSILTPAQRQQAAQLIAQKRKQMRTEFEGGQDMP